MSFSQRQQLTQPFKIATMRQQGYLLELAPSFQSWFICFFDDRWRQSGLNQTTIERNARDFDWSLDLLRRGHSPANQWAALGPFQGLRKLYHYYRGTSVGMQYIDDEQIYKHLAAALARGQMEVHKVYDPHEAYRAFAAAAASSGASSSAASDDSTSESKPETTRIANGGQSLVSDRPAAGPKAQEGASATTAPKLVDNTNIGNTAPTPLSAVELRQERYHQRRELIDSTKGVDELEDARNRLAFNNDNILRAEAAQYVYSVDEYNRGALAELPPPPIGLTLIEPESVGLSADDFTNKKSGFGAALFKSEISGETMLTYRGTNNSVTGKEDWLTNLGQGSGFETEQYTQAMRLAVLTEDVAGDDFVIVGHSLGGGLASSGVAVTGQKGYTFNSAGLHPNTAGRLEGLSLADTGKLITSQAVNGEVLTMAQSLGVKALLTGAAVAAGGPVAGFVAAAGLAAFSTLPKAAGELRPLPSVKGGNPVTRHGMDQVIDGIEAQKSEDIKTITDYSRTYNG